MGLIWNGLPHCKRCHAELEEVPEICPHCGYHPRDTGLKVSGYALMSMLVLVLVSIGLVNLWPAIAAYVMLAAGGFFLISVVFFIVAFAANPYRLGSLFK